MLEDFLLGLKGCLLIVSHDHYFLNKLTSFIHFEGNGKVRGFLGNYNEYHTYSKKRTKGLPLQKNKQQNTDKPSLDDKANEVEF